MLVGEGCGTESVSSTEESLWHNLRGAESPQNCAYRDFFNKNQKRDEICLLEPGASHHPQCVTRVCTRTIRPCALFVSHTGSNQPRGFLELDEFPTWRWGYGIVHILHRGDFMRRLVSTYPFYRAWVPHSGIFFLSIMEVWLKTEGILFKKQKSTNIFLFSERM